MAKKLLLLVGAGAAAWWFFIGGRTINESHVRGFYEQQMHATLSRDPKALCGMLASDFVGEAVEISLAGRVRNVQDRDQACNSIEEFYASMDKLGSSMGGMLQIDYDHEIIDIKIDDARSAVVKTRYKMDLGGSIINLSGTSTDTLIRRNGKVRVQRTEGKVTTRTMAG
ncbi:MAG: hypothetical protein K0Q76_1693 [Panacagrimonas sp.]|nr:hypothetical protein [Panacagrimonas sp.]MCC2656585.1 hypothetical protein [Panacagrimonas sp.]